MIAMIFHNTLFTSSSDTYPPSSFNSNFKYSGSRQSSQILVNKTIFNRWLITKSEMRGEDIPHKIQMDSA